MFQDLEGYAVAQFRQNATSWKVLVSIPDGFMGIFQLLDTFGPRVNSASNINKYQRYLLERKDGQCLGLTTLPPSYADSIENMGASTSWTSQGLFRSVYG
jgi:hypothetical protein